MQVDADDVLVRLDRTMFDLAVQQARAAWERADKEYLRASNLLAERVIPQSRFDAVEEQWKHAKAALETAQEHLKDVEIRSPLRGVVVERNVEVGQSVAPGMVLLRIVDQSSLKADFDLPETDFGQVAVGMPVTITLDSFPGQDFSGRVTSINPLVDPQTRTFQVESKIPNPDSQLVEGMFARARLSVGRHVALGVPRDALQRLPGSGTVYAFLVKANQAVKQTVKVGAVDGEYAEVLEGLREGDLVITSGAGRLQPGLPVKIVEAVKRTESRVEEAQ